MEILSDVVNYLLSLGAAIFVPIIIIIAGLIVRMKLKDAISADYSKVMQLEKAEKILAR